MKTKLFLCLLLAVGSSTGVFAQGRIVANSIREYINADVKIVPREDGKGVSIVSEEPMYVAGQKVNYKNSAVYIAFSLHPEWDNVLLVADWTGSMYSYVGQIIRWHKLNIDKELVRNIVLFNDGDDAISSKPKRIGGTGGIYYANPNDIEGLLEQIEIAVDNGDGGDAEENDIEAILAGLNKFQEAQDIVLVADSSPVRDIKLMYNIEQPVNIIICDTGNIQDYIRLAYYTGGTITSAYDDIDFSDRQSINPANIVFEGNIYDVSMETATLNKQ
ncbi:MAG: hypothetical protein C0596_14190 [Marinilabiliales bacterium]|nr:MAG: hypothetical protein C0596_14190 [Marinilabiliales bacterium]